MNKLLALVLLLFAGQALAQQKPQYSQYTINNYLLNPAISGIEDYADIKLGIRQQWTGLEGAPQSYYATMHMPINKSASTSYRGSRSGREVAKESSTKRTVYKRVRPHHGVGAMAMSTQTGPLKRGSLSMSYAYHLPLSRTTRLSAGVAPGLIQYSLNPGYVRTASDSDPAIMDGRMNETKFDLSMGLWLYSQNYYVGVAGAQLAPSKRKLLRARTVDQNYGELQKHYYLTAGYRADLTSTLSVIPSVLVRMAEPSPAAIEANMKVLYANRVWAGATYRHNESAGVIAGININYLFDVAYAYETGTSALGSVNSGSHEVVVGFKLRNNRKVVCPEWAW